MPLRALVVALALLPSLTFAGPKGKGGDGGTKGEEKEEECRRSFAEMSGAHTR